LGVLIPCGRGDETASATRKSFALITGLFLLPAGWVATQLISQINYRIDFARQELRGNEYLRPLKQLLEDVTASRLLAARLNGSDVTARPALIRQQAAIERSLGQVMEVDKKLGKSLGRHAVPASSRQNWEGLGNQFSQIKGR